MGTAGTVTSRNGFTLLIISISLAAFMTALDGTIVNIALPTISEAFDVSTSTVSWGIDNLPARHLGVHPDLREGLRPG